MADARIIEYKGVKMVYTDIENCNGDEAVPAFIKVRDIVAQFPDKSVLSLVNATNARFNTHLLSTIKETVKINNPKSKATVVFGLNKLSSLIVSSIVSATGRNIKLAPTMEEGQELLYQDEMVSREKEAMAV